ncbi:Sigma non-opioid intracellular receptor 1 [Toxocara canis]|uniref:Sigma non-opioid intracellular receptor 1 n=1 Tax=Toxocara canis TaxID=6265 RepID=A0A0B2VSC8_TOXCA|nr:Sigma non-opioid intracellular receptor 1 [Toxocara canis]
MDAVPVVKSIESSIRIINKGISFSETPAALASSASETPVRFFLGFSLPSGANGLSNVNKLRNDLRRLYHQHIIDSGWEAAYGGGLSLRANFLHASLTEFIVVFHAPHHTAGFSGWHWANITCTVLNGEISRLAFSANGGNKETFKIGNNFRHGEFERYTYELAQDTFAACYGRGAMPLSSVWLGAGALANSDPVSFARLTFIYMQGSFHEVGMAITKTFQYYKAKALKTEL